MTLIAEDRQDLLERYGRFYGRERFAVAFTASVTGDDAKRVTTKGWDRAAPLADGNFGAALIRGRGQNRNIAIVLRPSNLIVLECDTPPDLERIGSLDLPDTITVQSSAPYKRHFYFRPAGTLESIPYVAFRFESGKLTADSGRYFLAPPSIHPSGAVYSFLPGHGPDDVPIAELPEILYAQLSQQARVEDTALRESIALDPGAKIKAGNRRDFLFRYACMQRRWGHSQSEILAMTLEFNKSRCEPPVDDTLVAVQVEGAMKKKGGQELEAAAITPPETFTLQPVTARSLCDEPDIDTGQLLGPLVLTGGRTIVVGDTGQGKTTLALQMVRAILDQQDFLGYHGAGAGRALIVDLEQGRRTVKRALRDANLAGREDVDLVLVPDGLALDSDPEHLDELKRILFANGPYGIVILDPYYKAHRADEPNAERPIVDLMRILDALRATHGFALILPAHPRKPPPGINGARKLTIHDVAGSGAVTRGAEVVLGIERVSHGFSRLRYLKDREGDLPVDEAWNLIYSKTHGFIRDPKDGAAPRDYKHELLTLDAPPEWRTLREYRELLGASETITRNALNDLVKDGKFECTIGPEGRRSDARCWRHISATQDQLHLVAPVALNAPASRSEVTATGSLPPLGGRPPVAGSSLAPQLSATPNGDEDADTPPSIPPELLHDTEPETE